METIQLKNQLADIVSCEKCEKKMVNIDADELAPGDLATIKKAGLSVSNPETDEPICINCEYTPTILHRLSHYFSSPSTSEDDDSSYFHSSGGFLGGSSFGGFSSGSSFGGFGGGSFSGGGASAGF